MTLDLPTTGSLSVTTGSLALRGRPLARVTAILISRDGAAYLPRALAALKAQVRPPDDVLAVDLGSRDGSHALLAEQVPQLLRLPRRTSFGDGVRAALAARDLDDRETDPLTPEWLWLLHDDCAPDEDVLQLLLEAVDRGASVGIAGCKQVSWTDRRVLLDVGFTTSRLGTRVTGVDAGDIDQGQLDHRSDVLAVSTAGMLIRRDLWTALGGPDPALREARDDLDLCRRAHLAGRRVVVVPAAVVAHAAAGPSGLRTDGELGWWRRDRRDAVHLRLATARWPLLPLVLVWLLLAAVARAIGRLALKQPERAGIELAAVGFVLLRPLTWLRGRWRNSAAGRLPAPVYRQLLAQPRLVVRQRRDAVAGYLRAQDRTPPPPPPPVGRSWPALLAVLAVALVAGLAGVRALLAGNQPVQGPGLLPTPTAGQLWRFGLSDWRPIGLGRPGAGDPLDLLLAGLSWAVGGIPDRAVLLLLTGAIPLAALSAWLAAGQITRSRALRVWAALAWAGAPPLLGAVAGGRLGAVIAHLLLPIAGVTVARAAGAGRAGATSRSITAASTGGLLLTAVLAGAPMLAAPVLLGLLLAAAIGTRRSLLWTAAIPAVLLLPWWRAVAADPRLLVAEPGGPSAGPAALTGTGWHLLGVARDPGTVTTGPAAQTARWLGHLLSVPTADVLRGCTVLLAAPLLLLALAGVLARGRRGLLAGGLWLVGLAGLVAAAATVASDAEAAHRGWPGPGLSLFAGCLLGAALCRLDGAATRLRARALGGQHWVAVVAGLAAVLAPVGSLAIWAWQGSMTTDRVHRARADLLPATAAADVTGPLGTRTLVLRSQDGRLSWSLARTDGPVLGQQSAAAAAAPTPAVTELLNGLLVGRQRDQRTALVDLGIGSVLLLPPADDAVELALDTALGLDRVSSSADAVLWRVDESTARARVVDPSGTTMLLPTSDFDVRTTLPVGPPGRRLLLAETADPGWRARLDGRRLAAVPGTALQTFALPAAGGQLTVRYALDGSDSIDLARLGVAGLAVLMAVPVPHRRWRRVLAGDPEDWP